MSDKAHKLKAATVRLPQDYYERAINNYSIIMRMLSCFEEEDSLLNEIPKTFVEESLFDICKVYKNDHGIVKEGFFSIDGSPDRIDVDATTALNNGAISPSVVHDAFGYHTLYIHPVTRDTDIVGFVLLGKKSYLDMDQPFLRELGCVCNIYNRSALFCPAFKQEEGSVSKGLYATALREFPHPLLLIDKNGSIGYANRGAKSMFEGEKGLLTGEIIDNLIPGFSHNNFRKQEGPVRGEATFNSSDGPKLFKVECYPIAMGDTSWHGLIFRDALEMKVEEEETFLRDKMENIGMLAGGIGHDFNNLLTGVLGYASMMKNVVANEEKLGRYADAIEGLAQRGAKLTQHLLNISRRRGKTKDAVDLNVLLEDILFLLRESCRDIQVENIFDNALVPIRGDEAELQNVFLNLFVNAKEAMGGKGLLRVTTENKQIGGTEFASVAIEDAGQDIDEEIRDKIWQSHFTTENTGSSLGMGLYLAKKVIEGHGGFIEYESEPGKGTRFMLYLPGATAIILPQTGDKGPDIRRGARKQKILVIDDEKMVRELVQVVLTGRNMDVRCVADGHEAIELFKKRHNDIDLVILEMILPGIKGDEVLKALREIRSDIKIIISSGSMSEDQKEKLREYRVDGFLDKPYKDKDVIGAITRIALS